MVAYNGQSGVHVLHPSSLYNTITQNSIHDNGQAGIDLHDGGNAELEMGHGLSSKRKRG
jgi:parallel beta-helix repeat protein